MRRPGRNRDARLAAVVVALASLACGPPSSSPPLGEQVDRVFAEYDRPDSPGCAVGVFDHGELAFGRGYGRASLELGVPNSTETVYYVGSVSKQFVAASQAAGAPDEDAVVLRG